jgi:DNA replication protein DnaC
MTVSGKTNQDYLINLFREELASRKDSRISRYMKEASFPYPESFEDFITDEVVFPEGLSFAECRDLKFLEEKKNIIMYGKTGTGKTMLSICIGLEACKKDIPVQFYRTASLINQLVECQSQKTLTSLKQRLNKARILILDEFGYLPYDLTGAQLLFDYLSEIHGKKVIILNTNKEFSQWSNVLYDPDMAAALIGRLTHRCYLLLFPGENYRFKNSSINNSYLKIKQKEGNTE